MRMWLDVPVNLWIGLAGLTDGASLAAPDACRGALRHGAGAAPPAQGVQEQRRDHRGDRDAEDRARDARHLEAHQHRPQDDDRVDPQRGRHDPGLEPVHDHEPADRDHDPDPQRDVGLAQYRDQYGRDPREERSEERDRHEQAGERGGDRGEVEPEGEARDKADRREGETRDDLATNEPAKRARDRLLEHLGLGLVARRHEPEHERDQPVAVGDHVQREHDDQQQIADRAQARDGQLLERHGQLGGVLAEVVEEDDRLRLEVDLQADIVEPRLPRLQDRRQVCPQPRQVGDEVADRANERGRDDQGDHHEAAEDQQVDREDRAGAGDERHGLDALDDRAEHERKQPGQEEDHDQVAEDREDLRDEPEHDERERKGEQDEDGVEPAAFSRRQLEHGVSSP